MKTLIFDELLGALKVHEVHLQKGEKLVAKDPLALKIGETSSRKAKKKHFKAFKVEEFDNLDETPSELINESLSIFKQMLKKKGKFKYFSSKKDKYNKYSKKEIDIVCFECKTLKHIKVEYPKLRKM
ncbi:hypothetical protein CR513_33055, partial [Mucuna pruriens]